MTSIEKNDRINKYGEKRSIKEDIKQNPPFILLDKKRIFSLQSNVISYQTTTFVPMTC